MCRERLLYSATDKGRYGTLGQIGPLSMHDVLGAEDFAPAEANIELDRMCGPIWTFGCCSTNFGTDGCQTIYRYGPKEVQCPFIGNTSMNVQWDSTRV